MAINTAVAFQQADQLRSYETQLTQAKNLLRSYQSSLTANWNCNEMTYISRAIDQVLSQITSAQNQLMPLAHEIKNTAEQIQREEQAVIDSARKQVQIRQLRTEMETAQKIAEELKKKLDELIRNSGNQSMDFIRKFTGVANQARIKTAQMTYTDAARRVEEIQNLLNQIARS